MCGASTGGSWTDVPSVCGEVVGGIDGRGLLVTVRSGGISRLIPLAGGVDGDVSRVSEAVADAANRVSFVSTMSCGDTKVARSSLGALYVWGSAPNGERGAPPPRLFIPASEPTMVPRLVGGIIDVALGIAHVVAVASDGFAYSWGSDAKGACGSAPTSEKGRALRLGGAGAFIGTPRALVALAHAAPLCAVACGDEFTLLLSADGSVWATGAGGCGQLGVGRVSHIDSPVRITFPCARTSLRIQQGGEGKEGGEEGSNTDGTGTERKEEVEVVEEEDEPVSAIIAITAGAMHALALTKSGVVYSWGFNASGQLGLGDLYPRGAPTPIYESQAPRTSVLTADGVGTEDDTDGALLNTMRARGPARALLRVSAIAAGPSHSALLAIDGRVLTMGCAEDGRLGHSFLQAPANSVLASKMTINQDNQVSKNKWPFASHGMGPLATPKTIGVPYSDPPHTARAAARIAAEHAAAEELRNSTLTFALADAGTWVLPLAPTRAHVTSRVSSAAHVHARATDFTLTLEGGVPPRAAAEDVALRAATAVLHVPRGPRELGTPWLRTPLARTSVRAVTVPTVIAHAMLMGRSVTKIACSEKETILFSRE